MTSRLLRTGAPILALTFLACTAGAAPLRPEWSLALASGTTRFDSHLADYQWDLAPRAAWGAQAGASLGRFGLALRGWTSSARQHVDANASTSDPAVRVTTFDLAGEAELARPLGFSVLARASAGRVALTYAPDHVTLDAGGTPVTVDLAAVHAWAWGGGAAVRHPLLPGWAATIGVERSGFAFDTAHRAGASIDYAREDFGNWNGRLELARTFGTR